MYLRFLHIFLSVVGVASTYFAVMLVSAVILSIFVGVEDFMLFPLFVSTASFDHVIFDGFYFVLTKNNLNVCLFVCFYSGPWCLLYYSFHGYP